MAEHKKGFLLTWNEFSFLHHLCAVSWFSLYWHTDEQKKNVPQANSRKRVSVKWIPFDLPFWLSLFIFYYMPEREEDQKLKSFYRQRLIDHDCIPFLFLLIIDWKLIINCEKEKGNRDQKFLLILRSHLSSAGISFLSLINVPADRWLVTIQRNFSWRALFCLLAAVRPWWPRQLMTEKKWGSPGLARAFAHNLFLCVRSPFLFVNGEHTKEKMERTS